MPEGIDIAAGIGRGINAFTQAFLGRKLQKQQMKLQENMPLIEILQRQASDPTTSFYERARIMNQIPKLLGIKNMPQDLSTILGYDKLNEKDFETGETKKVNNSVPSGGDPNSLTYHEDLMKSVSASSGEPTRDVAITKKYGDVTPAEIHKKLQLSLDKAKDNNDVDKQARILKINYTLQKEILGKGGYTQEVSRGYDAAGNYQAIYKNADGDVKVIDLGKFEPEILRKAKLMATGKGVSGRLGQVLHANSLVAAYENDPTSISLDQYNGAKSFLDQFEKTGEIQDTTITGNTQRNTGTQPIQPAQNVDDERAKQDRELAKQKAFDDATAQALQTSREASEYAALATQHWNNVVEPLKDRVRTYLIDKDEKPEAPSAAISNDPDFKTLQSQLDREISNYNLMKSKAEGANARDVEAKQRVTDAKSRLGNSSNNSVEFTPLQKKKIAAFRNSNPTIKDYSDDKIAQILKDANRF